MSLMWRKKIRDLLGDSKKLVLLATSFVLLDQGRAAWQYGWQLDGSFQPVTLLSFLPKAFFNLTWIFWLTTAAFLLFASVWSRHRRQPFSAWLCLLLLLIAESFYLQNVSWSDHRMSLLFFLVLILAAEESSLSPTSALRAAQWGFVWFYMSAGLEKILTDPSWANGSTLQVFAFAFGRTNSLIREGLLESATVSTVLQSIVLILEVGAFFLLHRRLKWVWLAGLCFFHLLSEELMAYRYFAYPLLMLHFYWWKPEKIRTTTRLHFRPLTQQDLPLIYQWLKKPHIQQFYQREPMTLEQVRSRYGPRIQGLDSKFKYTHLVLAEYGGFSKPIGKIQCYEIDSDQIQALTVDLFIGEPDFLHNGWGRQMLKKYLQEIAFPLLPQATHCLISHIVENRAALNCSRSVGFRHVRFEEADGFQWELLALPKSSLVDHPPQS